MHIKPIRTEADYVAALATVDKLMDADAGSTRGEKLDVLTTLIEAYESKNFTIEEADPIEAIKHRMEALGLERKDLAGVLGSASKVSEVFARKRSLSLTMIRNLHQTLNVPLESLVRSYPLSGRDIKSAATHSPVTARKEDTP